MAPASANTEDPRNTSRNLRRVGFFTPSTLPPPASLMKTPSRARAAAAAAAEKRNGVYSATPLRPSDGPQRGRSVRPSPSGLRPSDGEVSARAGADFAPATAKCPPEPERTSMDGGPPARLRRRGKIDHYPAIPAIMTFDL